MAWHCSTFLNDNVYLTHTADHGSVLNILLTNNSALYRTSYDMHAVMMQTKLQQTRALLLNTGVLQNPVVRKSDILYTNLVNAAVTTQKEFS